MCLVVTHVCVEDKGSQPQCARVSVQGVSTCRLIGSGADITIVGGAFFHVVAAAATLRKRNLKRQDATELQPDTILPWRSDGFGDWLGLKDNVRSSIHQVSCTWPTAPISGCMPSTGNYSLQCSCWAMEGRKQPAVGIAKSLFPSSEVWGHQSTTSRTCTHDPCQPTIISASSCWSLCSSPSPGIRVQGRKAIVITV